MKILILLMTLVCVLFGGNAIMGADHPHYHPAAHQTAPSTEFPAEIVEVLATNCPVLGGEVNKEVFTLNNGHIYYFCCPGCIGTFNAAPEKYLVKLKDAPIRTLKVTNIDGKCPVSGLEASLEIFIIVSEDMTITFFHDEESLEKARK